MNLIEGSEQLVRLFGTWPTFHDAEVTTISLDRSAKGAFRGPTVRFSVHTFEITNEVAPNGFYVQRNHVLVTFDLYSTEVLHLDSFNSQNVLFGLQFSRPAMPMADGLTVQVDFVSSYGVSASFQCAHAAIIAVEPLDPAELPS